MAKSMKSQDRPKPLPVVYQNIPQELKDCQQWLLWGYQLRSDKWSKPPLTPFSKLADPTDPDTWSDFSEVWAAYEEGGFDGIGFALSKKDPFVAVDLDHCFHDNGVLNNFARGIIDQLQGYTEISPSGEGIRIFIKGELPRNRKSKLIELYDCDRYVTVTGQKVGE